VETKLLQERSKTNSVASDPALRVSGVQVRADPSAAFNGEMNRFPALASRRP
jgi:hypothetical protein